jgi:hypothetical protein
MLGIGPEEPDRVGRTRQVLVPSVLQRLEEGRADPEVLGSLGHRLATPLACPAQRGAERIRRGRRQVNPRRLVQERFPVRVLEQSALAFAHARPLWLFGWAPRGGVPRSFGS